MKQTRALGRTTTVLVLGLHLGACGSDVIGAGGGGGEGATSSSSTTAQGTTTSQGTSDASTGSGTGGASTSSAGGGSASFPDDCQGADDCPGGDCVEVGAGFRACRFPVEEATECLTKFDECCTTEDCDVGGGLCVTLPDASYCGGPVPQPYNACTGSQGCIDCGKSGGTCLEAGFYGYKIGQCVPRGCYSDDDCDAEAGGRCAPIFNPCCGAVVGLFCAYPSDGCRGQGDCGPEQHCEVDFASGRARCVEGGAQCPL